MLPKISAYCATYGRPNVLEEAVESFLRQDYAGEKELVILNDYKEHKLYFNHPEVKIYNVNNKVLPLGKKFNETISLCSGEIIFTWEDDDIYMPHRISYTINKMLTGNKKLFHTKAGYIEYEEKKIMNAMKYWGVYPLFHSNLAIYKSLFNEIGGYEEIDKIEIDLILLNKLFEKHGYISEKINIEDIFYIYRVNTGSYHATNFSHINKESISLESIKYVENNNNIYGDYYLKPFWKYDYINEINKTKANKKVKLFRFV